MVSGEIIIPLPDKVLDVVEPNRLPKQKECSSQLKEQMMEMAGVGA